MAHHPDDGPSLTSSIIRHMLSSVQPCFIIFNYFVHIVEAHERASTSALNGPGRNRTKGTVEREREGESINSRVERQYRGRPRQTMGVGRNEGQERMHGVDKMDTEETLRRENWKFGRKRDSGGGSEGAVNEGSKDHGFGLETI